MNSDENKAPDTSWADLSPEQLDQVLSKAKDERQKRFDANPAARFPWHAIQKWILFDVWKGLDVVKFPIRVILMVAANRSGKSAAAKGFLGLIARHTHPICQQFTAQDTLTGEVRPLRPTDPLRLWVIPPSLGKARQDWIAPPDGLGIKRWLGDLYLDYRASPELVVFARPPGVPLKEAQKWTKREMEEKATAIYVLSQDMDLLKFESSIVHAAFFDEEPHNPQQVDSVLMRLATTNGVIVFSFTPLQGLSWSFVRWWKPLVEMGRATVAKVKGLILSDAGAGYVYLNERGGRNMLLARWGMRMNPLAARYADEVENDHEMSEAEKQARLYGRYGYVEGALIPKLAGMDLEAPRKEHESYVVDELPATPMDWYMVADPNKSYGAILACVDSDDNLFFVAEHLKRDRPDWEHAKEFERIQKKYARGYVNQWADPGGAGAHSINNLNALGHHFMPVDKPAGSVATSIKKLRGRTFVNPSHKHPLTGEKGAPRCYFYRPGLLTDVTLEDGKVVRTSLLLEQLGQARQSDNPADAPDTPHKDNKNKLDLFDCARYASLLAVAPTPPDSQSLPATVDHTRLPTDQEMKEGSPGMDGPPGAQVGDWWVPTYNFEGE